MATIEIELKRPWKHVFIVVIFVLAGFVAGSGRALESRKAFMGSVFFWTGVLVFVSIEALLTLRWYFPVRLIIDENRLELKCKVLFLINKNYSWSKDEVSISYSKMFGLPSWNSLRISHSEMNRYQAIYFSQFILKEGLMAQILDELKKHGYNLNESGESNQ